MSSIKKVYPEITLRDKIKLSNVSGKSLGAK